MLLYSISGYPNLNLPVFLFSLSHSQAPFSRLFSEISLSYIILYHTIFRTLLRNFYFFSVCVLLTTAKRKSSFRMLKSNPINVTETNLCRKINFADNSRNNHQNHARCHNGSHRLMQHKSGQQYGHNGINIAE